MHQMGRTLDVHIEKIDNDDYQRRQQIRSLTACSESNEQQGLRHCLRKMIWLSGAWLCILPLMGQQGEEKEVGHNNLDIMAGITMEPLGSLP